MFETIDNLFLPIPADDRSPLIKLLDHVGIELVHFQAACAITVVLMALITLRKYGFGFLQHFGLTVLLKYGFLLAWLLNMPLAYLNELESEKAKWKVAKISPVPEGCAGQEMSTWTAVKGWFSFSQIKNHCDKWQQSQVDPIYKVSWLGVASQSAAEVIGPAFKEIAKHLRGSLDELLDGLGLYHQLMYTALTMVMLVIFFMWLFDFRFKLGGFLLGLEFGPKESTTPTLSIEDISEFRKVVRELSIVKAQQNQLTIAARVENLSSNATVASITGGGDGHPPTRLSHKSKKVKKVKKETHIETEDSFEHISDESSSDT